MQLVCVYTQYILTAVVENQLMINICVYFWVHQSVLLVYFYASTVLRSPVLPALFFLLTIAVAIQSLWGSIKILEVLSLFLQRMLLVFFPAYMFMYVWRKKRVSVPLGWSYTCESSCEYWIEPGLSGRAVNDLTP